MLSPFNDKELQRAMENFKNAIFKSLTTLLLPIVRRLTKILRKLERLF
jgi:hypothetical protein